MLTIRECSKLLNCSQALVYQFCQEKRLRHYRFGSEGRRGRILIDPEDLEDFKRRCLVELHPLLAAGSPS